MHAKREFGAGAGPYYIYWSSYRSNTLTRFILSFISKINKTNEIIITCIVCFMNHEKITYKNYEINNVQLNFYSKSNAIELILF